MKNWAYKKIEEIGKVQTGSTPQTVDKLNYGNHIPFIKPGDFLKNGSLNYKNEGLSEQGLKTSRLVEKNSVLMVCIGATIGKVGFTDQEVVTNQQINALTPLHGDSAKFIFYQMLTQGFQQKVLNGAGQATLPIINKKKWSNLSLYLPPPLEQKRIVAIVDQAFEGIDRAIANTQKNLTNARELFESYLNAIFTQKGGGWVEKPIYEISDVVSGYSFKSSDFSASNTLKSIKITNVGVQEFIRESSSYLPAIFAKTYSKFAIPENSLVIALTRSIISTGLKVAVIPSDYHCALLNQRVAALKVNSSLMSGQFLFSYLCTRKVVDYVQSQVNTLMQPNLSINDLRNMLVPVPSLEEQNQIVLRIEALSTETQRLEAIYRRKLAALTELKQAILQKAFTGELTADTTNQATKTAKEVIAA